MLNALVTYLFSEFYRMGPGTTPQPNIILKLNGETVCT